MAFSNDICKLVIENVELLEEAPSVIEEVENTIFREINSRIEDFIKNKDGWKEGVYTYYENEKDSETSFAPLDWPEDEDGDYSAWYEFNDEDSGDGCNYYLSALLGKISGDYFGFFFNVDCNYFGRTKKLWEKFLAAEYQKRSILQESGVSLVKGRLCIPITIDPKLMADEYAGFDGCLKPVNDALEILMKVNPEISEIVKEAKKTSA